MNNYEKNILITSIIALEESNSLVCRSEKTEMRNKSIGVLCVSRLSGAQEHGA